MRNLKVYKGAAHPHEAQKPEPLDIKSAQPQEREGLIAMAETKTVRRPVRAQDA